MPEAWPFPEGVGQNEISDDASESSIAINERECRLQHASVFGDETRFRKRKLGFSQLQMEPRCSIQKRHFLIFEVHPALFTHRYVGSCEQDCKYKIT